MVTATVLAILASLAIPLATWDQKRRKEVKLRVHLQQMRDAIDLYKRYADEGRILLEDIDQMGFPLDFEALTEGTSVSQPIMNPNDLQGESAEGETFVFLPRIPVDPITGEAIWGMRSYQDDFDSDSWGQENLYDVYSLSEKKALDGTYYKEW